MYKNDSLKRLAWVCSWLFGLNSAQNKLKSNEKKCYINVFRNLNKQKTYLISARIPCHTSWVCSVFFQIQRRDLQLILCRQTFCMPWSIWLCVDSSSSWKQRDILIYKTWRPGKQRSKLVWDFIANLKLQQSLLNLLRNKLIFEILLRSSLINTIINYLFRVKFTINSNLIQPEVINIVYNYYLSFSQLAT